MYIAPGDMTPEERALANCGHPHKKFLKTDRQSFGPVAPGAYLHRYEDTQMYRCLTCNNVIFGKTKEVFDGPPGEPG